jgi:hypothetical protein
MMAGSRFNELEGFRQVVGSPKSKVVEGVARQPPRVAIGLGGQAMNNGPTINELEERIAVMRQNIGELA